MEMMNPVDMPHARTIPALLAEQAGRYGDLDALVAGDRRYSYGTLWEEVQRFGRGLLAHGVTPGDHVAILMGNRPEWIIADLAIASIGATMVSVNTYVTAAELEYILKHSDADWLIHASRFLKYDYVDILGQIGDLSERLPRLRGFIHAGERGLPGSTPIERIATLGAGEAARFDELAAAVKPTDVAALLYTSGSTSTPKGVQIIHWPLIENMWHIGSRMHAVPGDRIWCAISMFWGLGCENILFNALTHAACLVLQEFFDPGEAMRLIEAERCTIFYGTSNMVLAMQEHPDRPHRDMTSLRTGGSSGNREQNARIVGFGATEMCNVYGLTESYGYCNIIDGRTEQHKRDVSVGRPLPGIEQRIVDPETQALCEPGEVGEIQIRGTVTIGYYKDADKNADAFTGDGFFRTGDLGFHDDEGFLYFRGRLKEMIKTGGINVSPAEVEKKLLEHPHVHLAYVVPVADPVQTEIVGAVVIAGPDADPATLEDELRALASGLSSYKRPRLYTFVRESELPTTNTGKVKRMDLPALFTPADA